MIGVHGPNWLGNTGTALPVVAMVNNWQYAGYNMLFFLAGLQSIPPTIYEAASMDGAGAVRRFLSITLPLLNPTILFVLVTDVIGLFQNKKGPSKFRLTTKTCLYATFLMVLPS